MIKITIWNEYRGQNKDEIKKVHPLGIHKTLEGILEKNKEFAVRTVTLDDPSNGLTDEIIDDTDVLIWWGHAHHEKVDDIITKKVHNAVLKGMGFIPLHSSHLAKPFVSLMGTSCTLKWRDGDFERLWTILPNHPIAKGVPEFIELEEEEMYGERFDIPNPDELVFVGWFSGGEIFRSGCVWNRGLGKVFYFQPGHETNPSYHNKHIQKIIENAVYYVAPSVRRENIDCEHVVNSYEESRKAR